MFFGCYSLLELDLGNWDTSGLVDINQLFFRCQSLLSLNLSSWDILKTGELSHIFADTKSLTNLTLNGWNVMEVKTVLRHSELADHLDLSKLPKTDDPIVSDPCDAKEIEGKLGIEYLEDWYSSLNGDIDEIKSNPVEYMKWCERIGL